MLQMLFLNVVDVVLSVVDVDSPHRLEFALPP
jgi:hypothetical protein